MIAHIKYKDDYKNRSFYCDKYTDDGDKYIFYGVKALDLIDDEYKPIDTKNPSIIIANMYHVIEIEISE